MKICIHPEALAEYQEATLYYGEQGRNLGADFVHEVEAAIGAIRAGPHKRAADARGVRRRLVRRFPYAIRYVLESESVMGPEETIMIYAVRHLRREPSGWAHRLPTAS